MAKTIGSFDLASLKNLRDDVTQYFWFESNSSSAWGSGAHVTLYPESQFTDSTNPNYMKGQNIIMNTDGFSIRNGALPMMVLDNDSLDFNAVDTTQGTYVTMATFGLTGATIGQTSNAHSVIDANGQRFYASDGTTQLANIGYGPGTDSSGGTSNAPYYTFGTRYGTVGNYSVSEGRGTTASGAYSHAEGWSTYATASDSHAEGFEARATGQHSHAEGGPSSSSSGELFSTTASGPAAHAEGWATKASGSGSHSQNLRTIAAKSSQTALGTYNIEDTSATTVHPNGIASYGQYAVIVGNGTADDARSNALTVSWNGNVKASGSITDGSGNVLSNKENLLAVETHHASVSLPASDYAAVDVTMTKTGYTFLGVVGFQAQGTGSTLGWVTACWKLDANTARANLRNSTSTARNYTMYITGLYVKNS